MLSAAVIAFITSLIGGTRIQCSGPTGPMTAVTATLVAFAHDQLLTQLPGQNPDHLINKTNPMRDLVPVIESETFGDEL